MPSEPETTPPLLNRYQWLIMSFIGLAIIAALGYLLLNPDEPVAITINPPLPTVTTVPTGTPPPIEVYITGEVAKPQSRVSLPAGSRIGDVIDAAGGVTEDADLNKVNLAQVVLDGDQIDIPAIPAIQPTTVQATTDSSSAPQATSEPPAPPENTNSSGLIDLNTATQAELETLPGIGAAKAQDIIAYREANGGFRSVEELTEVRGIGDAMLANVRDLVMVGGIAAPQATSNRPSLINLNTATQAELETLPGIGAAKAQDIIAYREANGNFQTIEDLMEVSGIGEGTFAELRDLITVE